MKEELIRYVMAKADECYSDDFPIQNIETWIREFFDQNQPERSKREDDEDPVIKFIAPLCDTIIELR